MKPILFLLIVCLNLQSSFAQSPFDCGKGKDAYFISVKDRKALGINDIYIINYGPKIEGGWWLNSISFTDTQVIEENHDFFLDSVSMPSVDTFINDIGTEKERYTFHSINSYSISNDKLTGFGNSYFHGGDATGITYKKDYALETYADYGQSGLTASFILTFYPNGFLKSKMVFDDSILEITKGSLLPANLKDLIIAFNLRLHDTLNYVYDSSWRIRGTINGYQSGVKSVFNDVNQINSDERFFLSEYKFHQCYINKMEFESFVDKKIGYRPKFIRIEISENAIYNYIYIDKTSKYYPVENICLERIGN
jgi:hypothetical protein